MDVHGRAGTVIVALALGLLATASADAGAASAPRGGGFKLRDDTAKCAAGRARGDWSLICKWSWKGQPGGSISLRARGRADYRLGEGGGDFFPEQTLAYGETWRTGPFRCKAIRPGVRCRSRASSHGFRLGPSRRPRVF